MKRSARPQSFASALSLGALATLCLVGTPAAAQHAQPPPEVIATLVPVYHEGHATYWYNGYWHYRDRYGTWTRYEQEPAPLRDHRLHFAAAYHYYGG